MRGDHKELGTPKFIEMGLLGRLLYSIGLLKSGRKILLLRLAAVISVTWLVMLVLSVGQGLAYGVGVKVSFLNDFAAHVRFLFSAPLFFMADRVLALHVRHTVSRFIENDIIGEPQRPRFWENARQMQRLWDSIWPEIVIIGIVILLNVTGFQKDITRAAGTWQYVQDGARLSWAGWWLTRAAIPFWQFLVLRWLMHVIIYTGFLFKTAKLDLRLISTHPDQVGGLHFLTLGQKWMLPFVFALSASYASGLGMHIIYSGATLTDFGGEIGLLVLILVLVVLAPLVVFSPRLLKTRRAGLLEYGALATNYVDSFERKWIMGQSGGEEFLGNSDIQSLADLANSYKIIQGMRPVPVDKIFISQVIFVIAIPMLPLFLTKYDLQDILKLVRHVLG